MNRNPVYLALRDLLAIKPAVTYAEVASVSGIKRKDALANIVTNKDFLKLDKKGRITGFISDDSLRHTRTHGAVTCGKVYWCEPVNYGADQEIKVGELYKEKIKDLETAYCVGGIGDNYWTRYVIASDKTHEEMRKRGFVFYDDYYKALTDTVQGAWRD